MEDENNTLIELKHIRQLAGKIRDELEILNERLLSLEGITGINCGEIIASNN